jgi:hypothetical protein
MSARDSLRRAVDGQSLAADGVSRRAIARRLTALFAVVVIVLTLGGSNEAFSAPPANFTDVSVVTGLGAPTDEVAPAEPTATQTPASDESEQGGESDADVSEEDSET